MKIRIHTYHKKQRYSESRSIDLNKNELTEIISKYIEEQYLKENEILEDIEYDYT